MVPSGRDQHLGGLTQHKPHLRDNSTRINHQVVCARRRRRKTALKVDESTPLPAADYAALLSRANDGGCPALFLAPMENLADRPFRVAFSGTLGGFDEACTEFIRVPRREEDPHNMARGLARLYSGRELGGMPLGAQIMGSYNPVMEALVPRLIANGAPRIDLNCGCPAGSVTGKGAGSSLLREPETVHRIVSRLVALAAGRVPVTVKMRSGFEDTALFEDNLLAVQAAGATFVTIHPRTRNQGYNGRADWSLIARAKDVLSIPVIGNGDVNTVSAALTIRGETGCDGIMIGRGAVQDPLLFHRVRAAFGDERAALMLTDEASSLCDFLRAFADCIFRSTTTDQAPASRVKQVAAYLLSGTPALQQELKGVQRAKPSRDEFGAFVEDLCAILERNWAPGGLQHGQLVNHMTLAKDKTRPNTNQFKDAESLGGRESLGSDLLLSSAQAV